MKTAMRTTLRTIGRWVKRHKIWSILLLLVVVLGVYLLVRPSSGTESRLVSETVETRDIVTYNSFVGNVEPAADRQVIPKASAEVLEVLVEKGDTVQEGDVIARLDTESVEYNIEQKEASLAATQTSNSYNIADARRTYATKISSEGVNLDKQAFNAS